MFAQGLTEKNDFHRFDDGKIVGQDLLLMFPWLLAVFSAQFDKDWWARLIEMLRYESSSNLAPFTPPYVHLGAIVFAH